MNEDEYNLEVWGLYFTCCAAIGSISSPAVNVNGQIWFSWKNVSLLDHNLIICIRLWYCFGGILARSTLPWLENTLGMRSLSASRTKQTYSIQRSVCYYFTRFSAPVPDAHHCWAQEQHRRRWCSLQSLYSPHRPAYRWRRVQHRYLVASTIVRFRPSEHQSIRAGAKKVANCVWHSTLFLPVAIICVASWVHWCQSFGSFGWAVGAAGRN